MLEKLKAILGEAFTEELGAKLITEIEAAFVPKADNDVIAGQIADLEKQLADAGKTIEGFKAMDIDGIKKAADDWKLEAENAQADAAKKIAEIQFNSSLTTAIGTAKGKNTKAIAALLDTETLKQSKNQAEDINAALAAVQKDAGYLFDTEPPAPPYAAGTGTANLYCAIDDMAAVRAAAGLTKEGVN